MEGPVRPDPPHDTRSPAAGSENDDGASRVVSGHEPSRGDETHRRTACRRPRQYAGRRAAADQFAKRRTDTANIRAVGRAICRTLVEHAAAAERGCRAKKVTTDRHF